MSVVEDLIGQAQGVWSTIEASLNTTTQVIEKIGESMEALDGALTQTEEARTGTAGILSAIGEAKQTTAGILGDDAVGGFVQAEAEAEALLQKLDGLRQAIDDLRLQFDAAKQETTMVADGDTGAMATTEAVIGALKAQGGAPTS